MCKFPLFAYQKQFPKCECLDGEYIDDPCVDRDHIDRKLHFLTDRLGRQISREKFDLLKKDNQSFDVRYIEVPCGQCIDCRLAKSREWASRIVCEQLTSSSSLFLTLTYDDDHLVRGRLGMPTCKVDDISKFFKDLRRYCQYHYGIDGIRHYSVTEYGDQSARPHAHSCVFNLPSELISQNVPYKVSFNGDLYYNNPILSDIWGKGHVVIGDLSFQSAAYVARYVVKKLKGRSKTAYTRLGIEPEQARMSRRPGIGSSYYDLMKDQIYKYDRLYLPGTPGVKPSSYFDKKFALDDPLVLEVIKGERQLSAELDKQYKLSKTDLDYDDYLKNEALILEKRAEKLVRPSI